jgi:hypothetical protein
MAVEALKRAGDHPNNNFSKNRFKDGSRQRETPNSRAGHGLPLLHGK